MCCTTLWSKGIVSHLELPTQGSRLHGPACSLGSSRGSDLVRRCTLHCSCRPVSVDMPAQVSWAGNRAYTVVV